MIEDVYLDYHINYKNIIIYFKKKQKILKSNLILKTLK